VQGHRRLGRGSCRTPSGRHRRLRPGCAGRCRGGQDVHWPACARRRAAPRLGTHRPVHGLRGSALSTASSWAVRGRRDRRRSQGPGPRRSGTPDRAANLAQPCRPEPDAGSNDGRLIRSHPLTVSDGQRLRGCSAGTCRAAGRSAYGSCVVIQGCHWGQVRSASRWYLSAPDYRLKITIDERAVDGPTWAASSVVARPGLRPRSSWLARSRRWSRSRRRPTRCSARLTWPPLRSDW